MLKLTLIELFIRSMPEIFICVFIIQIFTGQKISIKRYAMSSLLLSLIVYIIRLLPIHYGVHVILNIFAMVIICNLINKIPIIKATSCSLILIMMLLLCEQLNLFILINLLNININVVLHNPMKKFFCFLPSLIMLICICLTIVKTKKRRIEDVFY